MILHSRTASCSVPSSNVTEQQNDSPKNNSNLPILTDLQGVSVSETNYQNQNSSTPNKIQSTNKLTQLKSDLRKQLQQIANQR